MTSAYGCGGHYIMNHSDSLLLGEMYLLPHRPTHCERESSKMSTWNFDSLCSFEKDMWVSQNFDFCIINIFR